MARKLVQKRSRPSIAAKPVARIAGEGKDPRGSSSRQSHARTSNGSPDKQGWHATFSNMACSAARYAGHPLAFLTAVLLVLIWAVTGPLFAYSDTWQLVINTSTTIVTFLMVFLIQNSQNRDSAAIQVKLDELIRVSAVQNSFVGIEHLTDDELDEIRTKCELRAEAEKVGEETVKNAGKKAKRAADLVTE
jgi:low affinity Fe/Cu permease